MPLDDAPERFELARSRDVGIDELSVEARFQFVVGVVDVRFAAAHPGPQVAPGRTEDDDRTRSHVLARVVAGAFYDRNGSRVPDREPLARAARDVELPARCPVKNGVTDEVGGAGVILRWTYADASASH